MPQTITETIDYEVRHEFILNNLISNAQLHSYKAFTENDGKLTQDMRGYKCQTEDIKIIHSMAA